MSPVLVTWWGQPFCYSNTVAAPVLRRMCEKAGPVVRPFFLYRK
jgi:hypothetical protein